jgi:hypothetical protein
MDFATQPGKGASTVTKAQKTMTRGTNDHDEDALEETTSDHHKDTMLATKDVTAFGQSG